MNDVINGFNSTKILAIGDLMVDHYVYGTVTRISPEAPVPVIKVETESYKLGGAANAINNIKSLGGDVEAIGVIGIDDTGRILLNLLNEKSIDTEGIILCGNRSTTVKTRIIGNDQQIVRIDTESKKPLDTETTQQILKNIKDEIKNFNAILISDYDKGMITHYLLDKLIPMARSSNIPIIVEPKVENLLNYKNTTVVVSDLTELSQASSIKPINETSIRNMGQWLLTHLDCNGVLITRGKKGISLFEKDKVVKHFPGAVKEMYNVTGVKDVITSVMALALANGSDMSTAAEIASVASTLAAGKVGTITITREDLLNQIQ